MAKSFRDAGILFRPAASASMHSGPEREKENLCDAVMQMLCKDNIYNLANTSFHQSRACPWMVKGKLGTIASLAPADAAAVASAVVVVTGGGCICSCYWAGWTGS